MTRRKLIIVIASVTLIITMIVLFLLFQKSKRITQLTAGQIVATNIRYANQLPNQTDGQLQYFTGSTIATLNFPKSRGDVKATANFPHIPFGQVDRFSASSNATVVRAEYSRADSLLALDPDDSFVEEMEDGKNWFVIDKSGKVQVVPLNSASITDCIADNTTIYCLMTDGNKKQKLFSFAIDQRNVKDHGQLTDAVTFIAANNNQLVARDFSGKAYSSDGGEFKEIAQNISEIRYDQTTNKLVVASNNNDLSEEGGAITADKPQKLRVYSLDGQLHKEVEVQSSSFSLSRGYIITAKKLIQPTSLSFYGIDNNDVFTIIISQGSSPVNNTIREVHILHKEFKLLGVVTTSNQLITYGQPRYIQQISSHKLPIVRSTIQDYGYQYNIASNRLTIYYPTNVPNTNLVRPSLRAFEAICDCDPNQIAIVWEATAFEPGH